MKMKELKAIKHFMGLKFPSNGECLSGGQPKLAFLAGGGTEMARVLGAELGPEPDLRANATELLACLNQCIQLLLLQNNDDIYIQPPQEREMYSSSLYPLHLRKVSGLPLVRQFMSRSIFGWSPIQTDEGTQTSRCLQQ